MRIGFVDVIGEVRMFWLAEGADDLPSNAGLWDTVGICGKSEHFLEDLDSERWFDRSAVLSEEGCEAQGSLVGLGMLPVTKAHRLNWGPADWRQDNVKAGAAGTAEDYFTFDA
jgi:hypothetical protein